MSQQTEIAQPWEEAKFVAACAGIRLNKRTWRRDID